MSNLEISRAERLDQRVVSLVPSLSRAYAARLVEDGKVMLNGKQVTKPGQKIKPEDIVEVEYSEAEQQAIPDIELPILYEDDDCVVIDKPVGLLTHSKGAFNPEATVATWLRSRVKHMEGERAGIVHRLDRATSGVMICAKTPEALSWLQKQFAQRRTKKTYIAVIEGVLQPEQAVIDMPIERNPKKPQTFRVGANGKSSITHYKVLESSHRYSEVELKPETGRTHQLRVHLAHQHHPILGDTFYGGKPADRLYLHALSLELTLPNRERKVFTTTLPKEFYERISGDK
jgi:23S rRNA pseudouridine1911/1915/1917 synthase